MPPHRFVLSDLDALQSLMEKSLVRRWGSGRFGMLETIQEYARERLDEFGEVSGLARRHVEHYLAVAESANLHFDAQGEERPEVGRLEQGNLRAALKWTIEHEDTELGLRVAVALENFWVYADPFEAATWFDALLAKADELDPKLRARALRAYGGAIYIVGEFERGLALYEQSIAIYRALGDERGEAHMVHRFAVDACRRGDYERATALSSDSLEVARRIGDRKGEALAISVDGHDRKR